MKKAITSLLISILFLSVLTACGTKSGEAAKVLGLDVSKGEEISNYDTHGGFHGDGTTCIAYRFDDDTILEEIKSSSKWSEFPLNDTVQTLIYMMNNSGEHPIIPEIRNGYYLLIDRQNDAETDILHRYSFNFTLGLYDTDTNTLYFCELDT